MVLDDMTNTRQRQVQDIVMEWHTTVQVLVRHINDDDQTMLLSNVTRYRDVITYFQERLLPFHGI